MKKILLLVALIILAGRERAAAAEPAIAADDAAADRSLGSAPSASGAASVAWTSTAGDIAGMQKVSDAELAQNRGGFVWAGVEVSLGAEMRTYLNGNLVLQTDLSWTPDGAQKTQMVSGALTKVDAATLQSGLLSGSGISVHVGNDSVFLANQGQTILSQRTDNGLQNVLINRASNLQISQQVDATIGLKNFGQFQNGVLTQRIGTALSDMVGSATTR